MSWEQRSWLRVFRSGDALRVGHGGRQARQTEAMRSEKCVVRCGRTWDGMRVIAVCFTRTLQRCACPTNTHFLLILQEVKRIAKTRNQLMHKATELDRSTQLRPSP